MRNVHAWSYDLKKAFFIEGLENLLSRKNLKRMSCAMRCAEMLLQSTRYQPEEKIDQNSSILLRRIIVRENGNNRQICCNSGMHDFSAISTMAA